MVKKIAYNILQRSNNIMVSEEITNERHVLYSIKKTRKFRVSITVSYRNLLFQRVKQLGLGYHIGYQ